MFKKTLLSLLFLLLPSMAHAATTWYACSGGGNWNGASSWTSIIGDEVGCLGALGNPVAGDTAILNSSSGNITLTASASCATITMTGYTGTLAVGIWNITTTAGFTLGGTITASSGSLILGGAQTLTSNGITWPCALNFDVAGTITLVGNWNNTGLVSWTNDVILNQTTSETLTANAGLTMNVNSGAGTAPIILGGGTWSGVGIVKNNLTLAGNSTVSGTVNYSTGTLTYSSGTITTTGSTLILGLVTTINTSGMNWNNISTVNTGPTITMSSDINLTGTLTIITNSNSVTFSGAHNISCAILNFTTGSTFVFPSSQTITVTSKLQLGATYTNGTILAVSTIKSATSSTSFNLNYTGTPTNEWVTNVTFTDVNASGSSEGIYNYNGAALTRTTNIFNITAANIGGFFIQ